MNAMRHIIATALLSVAALQCGGADCGPLGFRPYAQEFALKFASASEAEQVRISTSPLPSGKKLAASARWDDDTGKHLATHDVMIRNGWKGAFYLCGNEGPNEAAFCAKLLAGGCSIGIHTLTHPYLFQLNPNEQFFEIMYNRVKRESDCDAPVNSLAFPYNHYSTGLDANVSRDIGSAIMNAGIISSPFATNGKAVLAERLGYPPGTFAEAALIMPGDVDPSPEKADASIMAALGNANYMEANPCIAFGVHSWHTPGGLAALDGILKKHSANPDWWYCNQNEYGAYRFEALNCAVSKKTQGVDAVFSVGRFAPADLGADVSLWLKVEGGVPLSASCAIIRNVEGVTFIELPHSTAHVKPQRMGYVDNLSNKPCAEALAKSPKFPGVLASLHADVETGTLELLLKNENAVAVKDVEAVFHAPAGWAQGVIRDSLAALPPGGSRTLKVSLGQRSDALRYKLGSPFFAASVDFTAKGATRCRLYATARAASAPLPEGCPLRSLKLYAPVQGQDFAKLSNPSTDLAKEGLRPLDFDISKAAFWAVPFPYRMQKEKLPEGDFNSMASYEFESPSGEVIELTTDPQAKVYLNGAELKGGGAWILKPAPGRNRALAVYPNGGRRLKAQYMLWKGDAVFAARP